MDSNQTNSDQSSEVSRPIVAKGRTHLRPWRKPFLIALARCGVIRTAARKVGISRRTVERTRLRDPRFAAAMETAFEEAADILEAKARKMALGGSERVIIRLLDATRYRRQPTADRPAAPPRAVIKHELGEDMSQLAEAIRDLVSGALGTRREVIALPAPQDPAQQTQPPASTGDGSGQQAQS